MSMGSDKSGRERDAILAEEEARIAALYRKLPQTEPDARLDAAVKAMAHRALNPQLVATPRVEAARRRRVRWIPALGAAAGVVLAAGIAVKMGPSRDARDERGAPASDVISVRAIDAPVPPVEPPLSPPVPAAARAAAAKPAARPPEPMQEASPPAPQAAAAKTVAADRARPAAAPDSAAFSSTPGTLAKAEAAPAAAGEAKAFPGERQSRKRTNSAEESVERRETMAEGAWQNLHDRDAGDERTTAEPQPPQQARQDQAAAAATAGGVPPAAAARQAPQAPASAAADNEPAPAAHIEQRLQGAPATAFVPAPTSRTGADGSAAAHAPLPEPNATPAPQRSNDALKHKPVPESKDPNARLYPEHWLANIRTMLREKRRGEALRSLAEFRRLYPDYRLPDDLRDLK